MRNRDEGKLAYWRGQQQKWEKSGLSQRAYCEGAGINWSSFDYWRRQVLAMPKKSVKSKPVSAPADKPLALVPVQVRAITPRGNVLLRSPSGWEICLPAEVEAAWLSDLLKRLA